MKNEITLSEIYRYMALSFRYPEATWFNDDFWTVFFEIAEQACFGEDVKRSRDSLCAAHWLEDIQVEYTRLFVTGVPKTVASPYGSVYIDGNGRLYDKYTEKVLTYYNQKGFELKDDFHPPDYLVYQLEFMAMLVESDPDGLEEFITDYFRPWFEEFMERVLAGSTHPYFRLIVKVVDFFTSPES